MTGILLIDIFLIVGINCFVLNTIDTLRWWNGYDENGNRRRLFS